MKKDFKKWIILKEKIHERDFKPPFFKEGEIWWSHFGENVGTEMNGKSDMFSRPVIIYKKYDKFSFLGLPLTSKSREGTWYYRFTFNNKAQTAVLSQSRVISCKRLKEKIGKTSSNDFEAIIEAYERLHSHKSPKIDLRP